MTRTKWIIVVGTYLLMILGFYLVTNLHIDLSLTTLSSTESKAFKDYRAYAKKFPVQGDGIVVSLKSKTTFSTRKELGKIDDLCSNLLKLDGVKELNSITTVSIPEKAFFGSRNKNVLELGGEKKFKRSYTKLNGYPDVTPKFLSRDRKAARIFISIDSEEFSTGTIRKTLEQYDFEVFYISGKSVLEADLQDKISADLLILPLIAALVLLLLFFVWFQDLRSLLVILSILGLNAALVSILFWLTGISIGILTSTVPLLIIVLSFCDIVHVIHRYKQQDQSRPVQERLELTTKPLRLSLWLTSMTTFCAFALFFLSGINEIIEFAIITCSGIVLAYLTARFALPTFLVFFRINGFKRKEAFTGLRKFLIQLLKRNRLIAGASVALIIFAILGVWYTSSINSSFHQQSTSDTEIGRSMRFADKYFDGTRSIEVIISSDDVLTPKTVREVDIIESYLLNNYGCRSVFSVNSVIKRLNRYDHYGRQSFYQIPNDLSIEMVPNLLKFKDKLGLGNAVTEDQKTLKIVGRLSDIGSNEAQKRNARLVEFLEPFNTHSQHVFISGFSYVKDQSTLRVTQLILLGIALSLIVAGAIAGFVFRSWKVAIVSIIPNLIPLLGALLFIEFLGVGLNISSVMALSILLGLSLDDTIYMLGGNYVKGTKGISISRVEKSINENTFPVMVTSLILAAGFLVLAFSGIQSNRNIGILVAGMLLIALISDLLIFPALLRVIAKTKKL